MNKAGVCGQTIKQVTSQHYFDLVVQNEPTSLLSEELEFEV